MSHEAVAWARRQKVGGISTKAVLRELADRADKDTWKCFPSIATIADDIEASERVVKDALQRLEELGLIRRARRYSGYQKRLSDEYELMSDIEVRLERAPGKPRGKTAATQASSASADFAPDDAALTSSGADFAPLDASLGATPAPISRHSQMPGISTVAASRADSASTAQPVDNQAQASLLQVQNQQTSRAESAPAFKEEPPTRTSNSSSSLLDASTERAEHPDGTSSELTTSNLAAAGSRDDDQEFSVEDVILSGLDPRLNRAVIMQRLEQRGINTTGLSLTAAVSEVYGRVPEGLRGITDANAFVVGCIVKSPDTWRVLGPQTSICDREGHRFQRAYPVCIRECGAENPNWRDERDEDQALLLAGSKETAR